MTVKQTPDAAANHEKNMTLAQCLPSVFKLDYNIVLYFAF